MTLLSWAESAFIIDLKSELYNLTSGWRKSPDGADNNILKFDPLDRSGTTARYNPLLEIRVGTEHEHADIENVAMLLADPDGTAGRGNHKHWVDTATNLLITLLYHLLYIAKYGPVRSNQKGDFILENGQYVRGEPFEPTLEKLRYLLADPGGRDFKTLLREIMVYPHAPSLGEGWQKSCGGMTQTHPIAASGAQEAYQRPDNEAGSVLSTAANTIARFADPSVAANTSNATFRLNDLANSEKPTSLYVCIPPSELNRLVPLVRLLVTQIVTILASKLRFVDGRSERNNRHKLLLMLDEFPALGNMEIFETALAYIAGYGIRAFIVVQDLAQLQKRYGEKESILSNTHIQAAFAPGKIETARILSDTLGTTTVITESKSRSVSRGIATYTTNQQEQRRALLTPDEVMALKGPLKDGDDSIVEPGDMIIKVSGFPPIRGRQVFYFLDPEFSFRSRMRPVTNSDTLYAAKKGRNPAGAVAHVKSGVGTGEVQQREAITIQNGGEGELFIAVDAASQSDYDDAALLPDNEDEQGGAGRGQIEEPKTLIEYLGDVDELDEEWLAIERMSGLQGAKIE
jgi:type IV secretion system protein VirD4